LKSEIIEGSMSVECTIVDYAEHENIDLIVISTRGRSGFKRMLFGSIASKVVTNATCPLLVVKCRTIIISVPIIFSEILKTA
jgi:nucleotide-binding universal stress UspA family protein